MRWFRPKMKRVRLHLLDDARSFEGILVDRFGGHYKLLNAGLLEDEGQVVKLDGEAWVPETRVLFVQVLT